MRFLSGAAEDGEGSAAQPLMRRPDRLLSRRVSNLVIVSVVAAVIGLIAARIVFPSKGAAARPATSAFETYGSPLPSAYPTPTPTASTPRPTTGFEYAVAVPDLQGLPLDAAEGTRLELWVAWDDAYAEGPQMQRLVKAVTVARFIQPTLPNEPQVVVLSVPRRSVRAVMYGDLYGALSVAIPMTG